MNEPALDNGTLSPAVVADPASGTTSVSPQTPQRALLAANRHPASLASGKRAGLAQRDPASGPLE
jgi:hypothetical protein